MDIKPVTFDIHKHLKIFDEFEDNITATDIRLLCETKQATLYECDNGSFLVARCVADVAKNSTIEIMLSYGENIIPYTELLIDRMRERGFKHFEFTGLRKGSQKFAEKLGFTLKGYLYEKHF